MSVQIFNSPLNNLPITTLTGDDDEIYFKAKDVAVALGYTDPDQAIRKNVWNRNKFDFTDPSLRRVGDLFPEIQPHTKFLKEAGVYQLIFSSQLPSAKKFQDRVFYEVLPSIRKTGYYTMNDPIEKLRSMSGVDLKDYSERQMYECKKILKVKSDRLKDPVAVEKGGRGGRANWENIRRIKREHETFKRENAILMEQISHLQDTVKELQDRLEESLRELDEIKEFANNY